ncbi:MAG: BamA/TamA family outer membrane protein [Bacteroidales bacterium]
MKTNRLFLLLLLVFTGISVYCQDEGQETGKEEKIKTGWTFGGVPAIAYDSDIGFKYGAVVNFYHFGDGSTYPKYRHSVYLEWSRTTKGSGINQFTYDSEYLIPGIRVSAEASLLTEKALDFYGFNGYESYYNHQFEDTDDPEYISRMFYRLDRRLGKFRSDFYGPVMGKKLRWLAGLEYTANQIGTVDIDKLNKGKDAADMLPDTALLYDRYTQWGVIPEAQADGGSTMLIKLGIVYDTRDNEPNPMKGIWTDCQLLLSPTFLGSDFAFTRLAVTHRQYFTLIQKKLSFAYRLSYQAKLSGEMPYYMLPFVYNTAPNLTRDGLGGAKTIRGLLRNRVVGEDFAYGNFEFRWKFLRTVVLNQNLYIALNTFTDMGMVLKKYPLDLSSVPAAERELFFPDKNETLHIAYGAGLHFALNENFVVAVDYGLAASKDDGKSGLYIGLNFLY